MFSRRLKTGYFILEGLNSFVTVFYFYYVYFYMQTRFGFGNKANLELAALSGGTYACFAWFGGKFAQRFGYFTALKVGFAIMMASLAIGSQVDSAAGQVWVMIMTVVGMSAIWPTLEALASEGESPAGLKHMVGVYNVIWAATGAVAYFTGGAIMEKFGIRSLFFVPAAMLLGQLLFTFWLESQAGPMPTKQALATSNAANRGSDGASSLELESAALPPAVAKKFLRMAWLANPFAYIAINTLIAVVPGLAKRMDLSTMAAGFCCSIWCFARFGAFAVLWLWNGWHYRFRWLISAFIALIGSFALILLVPKLLVLVVAQIIFGAAVGLIYYSSLFYSMDSSETKGEHGGIHEAAIGLGNCAGPTVGAVSLHFLPQYANSGSIAVSLLLLIGLGGLLAVWKSGEG